MNKFEEYLRDVFASSYHGVDDDMPDAFNDWASDLYEDYESLDQLIDDFGQKRYEEGQLNKQI